MHMRITLSDGLDRAVPLFGLNAPDTPGILMVTSRIVSDTTVVGVLPFAPEGDIQADTSILTHTEPAGFAIALTTLAAGGGFVFDGFPLSQAAYLYVQGGVDSEDNPISVDLDVSFIPNCVPVEVRA